MIPSVANVLAVYNAADADSLREGLSWYQDAHNVAHVMAGGNRGQFGYSQRLDVSAGIIAALSPLNPWENNKAKALEFILNPRPAVKGKPNGIGLSANVNKAWDIYNGIPVLDVLKGDKVRAFYSTILDPAGDHNPVIDRHAFDIALGMRTNDAMRGKLGNKGVYDQFASCYREAAIIVGIGASQMQAITWVAWRKMHGIAD